MLIHSGSRSYGESILRKFLEEHKGNTCKGAVIDSEEFKMYMEGHN